METKCLRLTAHMALTAGHDAEIQPIPAGASEIKAEVLQGSGKQALGLRIPPVSLLQSTHLRVKFIDPKGKLCEDTVEVIKRAANKAVRHGTQLN